MTRLPVGAARAREVRDLRRQRYVERIYRLGVRPVYELVQQLARGLDDDEVDRLLSRYASLDPGILRALDGHKLPPRPLRVVGSNR